MWLYLSLSQQNITAKLTPIAKRSYCQEWQIETSLALPSGTILKHLMERIWKLSTLSSLASLSNHARILALQGMEKAWEESEVDCFSRSFAWPRKSSPLSYSLKTCRLSDQGVDCRLLEKLPNWGMIVDFVLYPQNPVELHIKENAGSCWPTPKASDNRGDCPAERRRDNPCLNSKLNIQNGTKNLKTNLNWLEWLMGYPSGWTELRPLETLLCPPRLEKLFASCRDLNPPIKRSEFSRDKTLKKN